MKNLVRILLFFTFITSCGDLQEINVKSEERLGAALLTTSQTELTSTDMIHLEKICDSFSLKASTVSTLFSTKFWEYNTTFRNCDPTIMAPDQGTVELKLVSQSGKKQFEYSSGIGRYYFNDFETNNQGLLEGLCSKLGSPIKKVQQVDANLYAEYFFYSGESCSDNGNDVCFSVDFAVKNQVGQFVKEYIQSLKVNTDIANQEHKRGFVLERSLHQRCFYTPAGQSEKVESYTLQLSKFLGHK